jgi:hypothetical protein
MHRDLSWNHIKNRLRQSEVKFLLQAMPGVAPEPAHLRRMGYLQEDRCPLCKRPGCDLLHILTYCPVALEQGRLTWRHNEVLRVLHFYIGKAVRGVKKAKVEARQGNMVFVKEGADLRKHKAREKAPPTLETACDWHIIVDLPKMGYQFPSNIAVTGKRPDLVLWSTSLKLILLIELTVPAERNVQQAYDREMDRYDSPGKLTSDCRDAGWDVEVMPMEVGTLGFIAESTMRMLKRLGAWSKHLPRL